MNMVHVAVEPVPSVKVHYSAILEFLLYAVYSEDHLVPYASRT